MDLRAVPDPPPCCEHPADQGIFSAGLPCDCSCHQTPLTLALFTRAWKQVLGEPHLKPVDR